MAGEAFTIVNNDGSDAIGGTFIGLPEGSIIPNFLNSGLNATVSYLGDSGNDVVLTVTIRLPAISSRTISIAPTALSASCNSACIFCGFGNNIPGHSALVGSEFKSSLSIVLVGISLDVIVE